MKQNGKRRTLTGPHVIAGFDRKHVLEPLRPTWATIMTCPNVLFLSNSDGGDGYTKDVFDELAAGSQRHEHFRDQ